METRKSRLTRFDCIPTRNGKRPSTICGPLHIQCSGNGDTKYVRGLITEVLTWPRVESTPPVVTSPDLISIHLKQAQGESVEKKQPTTVSSPPDASIFRIPGKQRKLMRDNFAGRAPRSNRVEVPAQFTPHTDGLRLSCRSSCTDRGDSEYMYEQTGIILSNHETNTER